MPARRPSLWNQVALWRVTTLAAAAAALFLLVSDGLGPSAPVAETRFVAVLQAGPGEPAWLVSVDTALQTLSVRPFGALARPDRAYELWLVTAPERPPRSLGVLDARGDLRVPLSPDLAGAVPGAAALAVSLEPLGGSPTGTPTGPVLFSGPILGVTH